MHESLFRKLNQDTEQLRILLGDFSTESIAQFAALDFQKYLKEDIGLVSPARQLFFILGILLTTKEPKSPKELDRAAWGKIKDLLNKIFMYYGAMYWPDPGSEEKTDAAWHRCRDVAMPAFLHFYNTRLMASTDQTRERIERYLVPFDKEIKELFGLSASEMLEGANFIVQYLQKGIGTTYELKDQEEQKRHAILDDAEKEGWDNERIKREAKSKYKDTFLDLMKKINKLYTLRLADLKSSTGKKNAKKFWSLFSSKRGTNKDFRYLTEANPAENMPMFLLSKREVMIPSAHSIYLAILDRVEEALLDSKWKDRFLRSRDSILEKELADILVTFFKPRGHVYLKVYENEKQQFEHDIIVLHENNLYIFEAKASAPSEPFREPNRAFIRIKRAFKSDRGIQKAYNQANRIYKQWEDRKDICLYNKKGELLIKINNSSIKQCYQICVTRDSFGPTAIDLSLLLEKSKNDLYPWAVNILDLRNLFDAFDYFQWGVERLEEYLNTRQELHGRVMAGDELDFAGYFIRHGTLNSLKPEGDEYQFLNPEYADIFTDIFYARLGGPEVKYDPKPPYKADLRKEMEKMLTNNQSQPIKSRTKQGRNNPCACGSGKKYKKCCGR